MGDLMAARAELRHDLSSVPTRQISYLTGTFVTWVMAQQSWLISWIGKTDHDASDERSNGTELGPIASALLGAKRYDRIYLLTNYEYSVSKRYCEWLERRTNYPSDVVDLYQVDLRSPIDYASIYEEVTKNLKDARLPRKDVEITFHLSPGTSAMTAIWIILAKTRFPAKLIQTSREHGLQAVDFFFDLASDFLPEFLRRGDERISRLVDGAKPPTPGFEKIIHTSNAMTGQIDAARRVAVYDVPVLILGETGTGKELFAEAIHNASSRVGKPYIAVNCGAITSELAGSELFGHRKGAFTGASTDRKGHFLEAHGGTLFLDEVGDLPQDSQVRLLRALQAREVTPLGASTPVKIDVRVIAATHKDLAMEVKAGRFREDLFHRLAVGILRLPPLRERLGDVELLIDRFMEQINADSRGQPEYIEKILSLPAKKLLFAYPWPGNVRELYHSLLRAAIWSRGAEVTAEDVQGALLHVETRPDDILHRSLSQGFDLQGVLDEVSRDYIARALHQSGRRKTAAARLLGFSNHQTLANWMKRLGVDEADQED
ncbi:sigma-54 interaction domain-containing protein [Leptothrix sp. BB-4]